MTAVNGVASFPDLSITKSGNGYTLLATDDGGFSATSNSFNLASGTGGYHLNFSVQPNNALAGQSLSPAVTVQVLDSFDNVVTADSSSVTLILDSNPGNATLNGSATVNAVAGVATFTNLSINVVGTGYTLAALDAALGSTVSSAFSISPAAPDHLTILQQPTNTVAGMAIAPAVTVQVLDAYGNLVTSDTSSVTAALGADPGSGTLSGTKSVGAVNGVATFSTLSIDKMGVGYTLTFTDSTLTGTTSSTFNITPNIANHLVFVQQPPSSKAAGVIFIPAVTVQIVDLYGNPIATDTSNVQLVILSNPGTATLSGTTSVAAVGGLATFNDLSMNKVGTNYTLAALDGILGSAVSSTFSISPGTANQLVFLQQPTNTVAGATITPSVTVQVFDQFGNLVTSDTSNVTVAIGTNPGGGTLSGTLTLAASGGVATFNNLSIDKAGVNYTLTASDGNLSSAISGTFNITPAAAYQLAFSSQPGNTTAGASISPAATIQVLDRFGNLVTTDSSSVTMTIGTNPGGGTLGGTLTLAASGGVASFNNLSIDKVGTGYTLSATDGGLIPATSNPFNIMVGAAHHLLFWQQPNNAVAGQSISPAVTVQVVDQNGNVVTTDTSSVSIALGNNPTGATLGGTTTVTASGGVAIFSTLSITTAGTGYTLAASDGSLGGATSGSFNITPAVAHQFAFGIQPTNTIAGQSIASVTVKVLDQYGNLVTSDTSGVTVAIGTNPGGGTLGGTASVNAVNGIATFSTLSINKTGTGYTLTAIDDGLTGTTSNTFNITPAGANHLAIVTQPGTSVAGAAITPALTVWVLDQFGNLVTSDSSSVTAAIGTNPGGGTLSGTLTISASGGIATFSTLSINKVGTGYTLSASDGGLISATSSNFNIIPAGATHLAFVVNPSNTVAGVVISPSVTVQLLDPFNNQATTSSATVTVAIGTNPGGGNLTGTVSVSTSGGVATFDSLSINKTGTGYTLSASSTGLTGAISNTFNITPAAASYLVFQQQPTSTIAGAVLSPNVKVQVLDQFGNVVTFDSSNVTMVINSNPGNSTLGGTTTVAAVNGVATFTNLTLNKVGTNYTLLTLDGTLGSAVSSSFNISPAAANHLAFLQQPTNTVAGTSITPALTVQVLDLYGNVVTSDTSNVTVAIGTNPGGGTLSGTASVNAVSGVATFSTLSINKTGVGYTLTATDGILGSGTSSTFNITPAAANQLAFAVQPGNTTAGVSISPAATVKVFDRFGNLVTTDSSNVTIAISTNPGGGTLSGTLTMAASGGVATFNNLSIDKVGTGYTLTASDGSLSTTTSNAFNITFAAAHHLLINQQPTNTVAGQSISPAVTVQVVDQYGNLVTTDTSSVTFALGNNPTSATLGGTKTVAAAGGVASFSALSITTVGTGYTLVATDGTLGGVTSSSFGITPAAANHLAFLQQPTNTVAGTSITPALTVQVLDLYGNVVTSDTSSVTAAIGTNPGGGTLSGTVSVNAISGVATFSTLSINKTGVGYTLTATDGSLGSGTSSTFNITPAAANQLAFTVQPGNATAGVSISPAATVTVFDRFGNLVTTDSSNVTIAISTNPGGGTLSGTLTVAASGGVASFNNLSIDKVGTGYTLTASDGSLITATSNAFNITFAAAHHLLISQQPTNTVAGQPIGPTVAVQVVDQFGNLVPTDTSSVTFALGNNPTSATLGGTKTVAAVGGVASFSALSITTVGTGYTLVATDGTLGGVTSNSFGITPAAADHLAWSSQPTNTVAGQAISSMTVKVLDLYGNLVTGDTSGVTAAIGTNPGGGTLSGTVSVNAIGGVATFSTLSINKTGTGYTLTASDGILSGATSNGFNITPTTANHLSIEVQPSTTVAGVAIFPAVTVQVLDQYGNVVTTDASNVTMAIANNAGGGNLTGTLTVTALAVSQPSTPCSSTRWAPATP